jgi:lipoprotein signal peptidase
MDRSRTRIYMAALLAGAVVVLDQAAKALAARHGAPAHNRALAFGIATGPNAVLAVSSIVMLSLFLVVIGRRAVQVGVSPSFPALIIGGGISNTFDRVHVGAVRDFIATPWAVVNVADLAVLGGIVALGVAVLLRVRSLRIAPCGIAIEPPARRATIVHHRDS